MLNRIILIGRLTKDPELRFTPTNNTAVANFTLAVDRSRKNAQGEKETDFINIVVWGKMGELSAQYLTKGKQAAVDGRLQIRSYTDKEGNKRSITEVVAENVQFLTPKDSGSSGYAPANDDPAGFQSSNQINDDDVPF